MKPYIPPQVTNLVYEYICKRNLHEAKHIGDTAEAENKQTKTRQCARLEVSWGLSNYLVNKIRSRSLRSRATLVNKIHSTAKSLYCY